MPFTLTTDIRDILTTDGEVQHYEARYLTLEGFRLEKGLWVRRTIGFREQEFLRVYQCPKPGGLVVWPEEGAAQGAS